MCAGCGLGIGEVDGLIETMRAAGRHKSRDELFEAWVDTYEDDERRLQAMAYGAKTWPNSNRRCYREFFQVRVRAAA